MKEILCNIDECEFCRGIIFSDYVYNRKQLSDYCCQLDSFNGFCKIFSYKDINICKFKNENGELNNLGKKRIMEMNL